MEIIRIPKRYGRQIKRLSKDDQLWILQSLFSLAEGEDITLLDSFAGDVLEQIWRESCMMEKKNVRSDEFIGGECFATYTAVTPQSHRTLKESKVKESKVNQSKDISSFLNSVYFEEFWEMYPKKTSKPVALKKWREVVKDEEEVLEKFKKAIEWQKESGCLEEYKFTPSPDKYIEGERWNDEKPQEEERIIFKSLNTK